MSDSKHRRRAARIVTNAAVGVILAGVFCLGQPWWFALYHHGFQVLLAGTVVYIITSHLE
jgi:hypothetical protein